LRWPSIHFKASWVLQHGVKYRYSKTFFFIPMNLTYSGNGIKLTQIYQSQLTMSYLMFVSRSFSYCYQLVNVISLGLAQRVPIKLCLLYNKQFAFIFQTSKNPLYKNEMQWTFITKVWIKCPNFLNWIFHSRLFFFCKKFAKLGSRTFGHNCLLLSQTKFYLDHKDDG